MGFFFPQQEVVLIVYDGSHEIKLTWVYVDYLQSETTTIDNGFNIFSIVCQHINIERFYIAMETYWQKMVTTKICVKCYLGLIFLI